MATTAGSVVDMLLKRVRGTGGVALTTNFAMQLVADCQNVINYGLGAVKYTQNLTPSSFYFASALRVIRIVQNDKELLQAKSWEDMEAYASGDVFNYFGIVTNPPTARRCWYQPSDNWVFLWPWLMDPTTLTITTIASTTDFSNYATQYNTAMQLADEDIELVLSLAELTCLLQERLYATYDKKKAIFLLRYNERKKVLGRDN
jgi:hypothetical protein